jgi:hypothetical protein
MRKARKVTATLGALAIASVGFASGAQANNGFDSNTSPPTQGNSGKTNENANPDNSGTQTTTTTGPHGQLKQGKDANTTTVTTGPGQSQH